mmetsp:Transcript_25655/g.60601  ORF Transcript_25655/g.60601 Transcript_25655/m.60601 type:complete len:85 (-) Transcript_25655:55-309(-)
MDTESNGWRDGATGVYGDIGVDGGHDDDHGVLDLELAPTFASYYRTLHPEDLEVDESDWHDDDMEVEWNDDDVEAVQDDDEYMY